MGQGLSEPEFYVNLVYKLKKILGTNSFSAQFIKITFHYKKKLHAWWSTQSQLATLFDSLNAHWRGIAQTL